MINLVCQGIKERQTNGSTKKLNQKKETDDNNSKKTIMT